MKDGLRTELLPSGEGAESYSSDGVTLHPDAGDVTLHSSDDDDSLPPAEERPHKLKVRPNTYSLWLVCAALGVSSLVRANAIAVVHFVLLLFGIVALSARRPRPLGVSGDRPNRAVQLYAGAVTILGLGVCVGHIACWIAASTSSDHRVAMYGDASSDRRSPAALNIMGFVYLGGDGVASAFWGYAFPDVAVLFTGIVALANEAALIELKVYRKICSASCATLDVVRLPFGNVVLGVLLLVASVASPSLLGLPNLLAFLGALLWWAFRPRPHRTTCCGRDKALGLIGCTPLALALLIWNAALLCATHLFQITLAFVSVADGATLRDGAWRLAGFEALPHMDWLQSDSAKEIWPAAMLALLGQLALVVLLARVLRSPNGASGGANGAGSSRSSSNRCGGGLWKCASILFGTLARVVASDLRPLPICGVACLIWATTSPSLLSLPLLIWAIVALVLPLTPVRWVGTISAVRGADDYTVADAAGIEHENIARRALRLVRTGSGGGAGLFGVPGSSAVNAVAVGDAVVVTVKGRVDYIQRQLLLPLLVPYCALIIVFRFAFALAIEIPIADAKVAVYIGVTRLDPPFTAAPLLIETAFFCFFAWCLKSQRELAAVKAARFAERVGEATAAASADVASTLLGTSSGDEGGADDAAASRLHVKGAHSFEAAVNEVRALERWEAGAKRSASERVAARTPCRKMVDAAASWIFRWLSVSISIVAEQISVVAIAVLFFAGMYRIDLMHSVYVGAAVLFVAQPMPSELRRKLWHAILIIAGIISTVVFVTNAIFSQAIPPALDVLGVFGIHSLIGVDNRGTLGEGWVYGALWTTSWWADLSVLLVLSIVTAIIDRGAQVAFLLESGDVHSSRHSSDVEAAKSWLYGLLRKAWGPLGMCLILIALVLCLILPPISIMSFAQLICVLALVLGRTLAPVIGSDAAAAAETHRSSNNRSKCKCSFTAFSRAFMEYFVVLFMGVMFMVRYLSQFPYFAGLLSLYWPLSGAFGVTLGDIGISELNASASDKLSLSAIHLFLQAILFCGCSLFCQTLGEDAVVRSLGAEARASNLLAASLTPATGSASVAGGASAVPRSSCDNVVHSVQRTTHWVTVILLEFVLPPTTPLITFLVAVQVATSEGSAGGLLLLTVVCLSVGFFGNVGLKYLWTLALVWSIILITVVYTFQFDLFAPGTAAWELVCARDETIVCNAANATASWDWIGLRRAFTPPAGKPNATLTTIHLGFPDGDLYNGAVRDLFALVAWPIALAAAALLQGWTAVRWNGAAAARAFARRRHVRSAALSVSHSVRAASMAVDRDDAKLSAAESQNGGFETSASISRRIAAATEGFVNILDVLLFRLIGIILIASAIWHQNAVSIIYLAIVGLWIFLWAFQGSDCKRSACCKRRGRRGSGGEDSAGVDDDPAARSCDASKAAEVMAVVVPMILAVSVPIQYALTIGLPPLLARDSASSLADLSPGLRQWLMLAETNANVCQFDALLLLLLVVYRGAVTDARARAEHEKRAAAAQLELGSIHGDADRESFVAIDGVSGDSVSSVRPLNDLGRAVNGLGTQQGLSFLSNVCFLALVSLLVVETTVDIFGGIYLISGLSMIITSGCHRRLTRPNLRWLVLYNWLIITLKVVWQAYIFPPFTALDVPPWENLEGGDVINFESSCVAGTFMYEKGSTSEKRVCFSWYRFFGTNKFARSTFCEGGGAGGQENCREMMSDKNGLLPSLIYFILLSILIEIAGSVFVDDEGKKRTPQLVERAQRSRRLLRDHVARARTELCIAKSQEYASEKEALLHLVQNMSMRMNAWDSEDGSGGGQQQQQQRSTLELLNDSDDEATLAVRVFARVPATIAQPGVIAVDGDIDYVDAADCMDLRCALRVQWDVPQSIGSQVAAYRLEVSSPQEAPPYIACFFPAGVFPASCGAHGTARAATVFGLLPNTPYIFRVAAVNAHGTGEFSQPSHVAMTRASLTPVVADAERVSAPVRVSSMRVNASGISGLIASALKVTGLSGSALLQIRLDAKRRTLLLYKRNGDDDDGAEVSTELSEVEGAGGDGGVEDAPQSLKVLKSSHSESRVKTAVRTLSLRSVRAVRRPVDPACENRCSLELILDSGCSKDEREGQVVIDPFALERDDVSVWHNLETMITPRLQPQPLASASTTTITAFPNESRHVAGTVVHFKDRDVSHFNFSSKGRIIGVDASAGSLKLGSGDGARLMYDVFSPENSKMRLAVSSEDVRPLPHERVILHFASVDEVETWRRRINALVPRRACTLNGELPLAETISYRTFMSDVRDVLEPCTGAAESGAGTAWEVRTSAHPNLSDSALLRWLSTPSSAKEAADGADEGGGGGDTWSEATGWTPFANDGEGGGRASPRARGGSSLRDSWAALLHPSPRPHATTPAGTGTSEEHTPTSIFHKAHSSSVEIFRSIDRVVHSRQAVEKVRNPAITALDDAAEVHSAAARSLAWIQFDLGRSALIHRAAIVTSGASSGPRQWQLERASDDGLTWIPAFDTVPNGVIGAAGGAGEEVVAQALSGEAAAPSRFWRITLRGYHKDRNEKDTARPLHVLSMRLYGSYIAELDAASASDEEVAPEVAASASAPPPPIERSAFSYVKSVAWFCSNAVDRKCTDFHQVKTYEDETVSMALESSASAAAPKVAALAPHMRTTRQLVALIVGTIYHIMLTHSSVLVYIAVAYYHVCNASLLSLPLPIVAFCYALVEYPRPLPRLWSWISIYVGAVIIIKWVWQLPLFCQKFTQLLDTPYYRWSQSKNPQWLPALAWNEHCPQASELANDVANMRNVADQWMKLVGIYKSAETWGGPSFQFYVHSDLILIAMLAIHRAVITLRGESTTDPSPFIPFSRVVKSAATVGEGEEQSIAAGHGGSGSASGSGRRASGVCGRNALPGEALPHKGCNGWAARLFVAGARPFEYVVGSPRATVAVPLKSGRSYFVAAFLLQAVMLLFAFFFFDEMLKDTKQNDLDSLTDVVTQTVSQITASSFSSNTAWVVLVVLCTVLTERVSTLLRSTALKWALLIVHCVGWHVFLFIVAPLKKPQFTVSFHTSWTLVVWYALLTLYWWISAKQLHHGYEPTLPIGTGRGKSSLAAFFRGYGTLPKYVFKVYMLIPFLFELKQVLDWACIPSSLDLFMWLKQQSLSASLFTTKCDMERRRRDGGFVRGRERSKLEKLWFGVIIVGIIISVVVGPIFIYSPINPTTSSNQLTRTNVNLALVSIDASSLSVTNSYSLYVADRSARIDSVVGLSNGDELFTKLQQSLLSSSSGSATQSLQVADKPNTYIVEMEAYSSTVWSITPPGKADLLNLLLEESSPTLAATPVFFELTVEFERSLNPTETVTFTKRSSAALDPAMRARMAALVRNDSALPITIPSMYPKAVRLGVNPTAVNLEPKGTSSCGITLSRLNAASEVSSYWSVAGSNATAADAACDAFSLIVDTDVAPTRGGGSSGGLGGATFVVVVSPSFSLLAGLGVTSLISFYAVIFIGVGRLFRRYEESCTECCPSTYLSPLLSPLPLPFPQRNVYVTRERHVYRDALPG